MTIKKIVSFLVEVISGSRLIKRTNWYKNLFVDYDHNIYPDNYWYRTHNERNYDIVNLGSSGAKWAFNYSNCVIRGMNWGQQPQTLYEDYQLLRHYHSILKRGATVIITIMPFTGLNKTTGVFDALKYLQLDCQGEPIQPYKYKEAQKFAKYPILFKKQAIKALVEYVLGKERNQDRNNNSRLDFNPMSEAELENDAYRWISGWKAQFSIDDFDAPLTVQNKKGREYRVTLMREIIDFCIERGYKPVYVIPPVTKHLSKYFTSEFEKLYIYDFLKEVKRDALLLDYSKNEGLANDGLFFNSFFLNKKGRLLFTEQVLKDLLILN